MILPCGWCWSTVGEIVDAINAGRSSGDHNQLGQGTPHLRPMNINRQGQLDLRVVKYLEEDSLPLLEAGDVLFNNTNSPELVGKTTYVPKSDLFAFSNHMTQLRPSGAVYGRYLSNYLHHLWSLGIFRQLCTNHVNQASVGRTVLGGIKIPVAPLAEQHRIVAEIEKHFTRLDSAVAGLARAKTQLRRHRASVLTAACEGRLIGSSKAWPLVRVDEVGEVKLGRQRAPQHQVGENIRPYLRVANVFEDRIDTSDILHMNFSASEFETFRLLPGDVLLNEGQSLELVGRAAVYRDEVPGACFQNTLIRFRAGDRILPRFALLVFRAWLHSGRFRSIAKRTTNIAHLGASRLAEMHLALPSREQQAKIVEDIDGRLSRDSRIEQSLDSNLIRAGRLRQSILKLAFNGRIVLQDPQDEPASALIARAKRDRIESLAHPKNIRRRRKVSKSKQSDRRGIVATLRNAGEPLSPESLFANAG